MALTRHQVTCGSKPGVGGIFSCFGPFLLHVTVNDKSFEGEKFRTLLGLSGMRGKVLQFFPSPLSLIHGFPTLQNSYECFNESFAFLA